MGFLNIIIDAMTWYCMTYLVHFTTKNSRINKIKKQTKILIRVNFKVVRIQHHQKGISYRDPGRSGGEEGIEKRDDDLQHHQQGALLDVLRRPSIEKLYAERWQRQRMKS